LHAKTTASGPIRPIKEQQSKGKGKAGGPEGSRKLRFPDFMTRAQDGDKLVILPHRPPLSPGNAPGTHLRNSKKRQKYKHIRK